MSVGLLICVTLMFHAALDSILKRLVRYSSRLGSSKGMTARERRVRRKGKGKNEKRDPKSMMRSQTRIVPHGRRRK